MLRTYALSPDTLRRFLWRTLLRFQVIVTLSFLVFGLYLALFAKPVDWSFASLIMFVIGLAYFFIIFFNYRQQARMLFSVRYDIDGNSIIYRQRGQDVLRIMRADITYVLERGDGLWIETRDPRVRLLIPYGLARDGDADMLNTLQAWTEVERRADHRNPLPWLLIIGLLGALLILLFANTLYLILPLGALLVAFALFTERRVGRNYPTFPGIVRMYSMAFSFLIFIILMKSCFIGLALAAAIR